MNLHQQSNAHIYMRSLLALLVGIFFLVPALVSAETVLRMSESVTLDADQTVEGDFYGFAGVGPVVLSGTVRGDAHVFGSTVTVNGPIEGDLSIAGGVVHVHATVTDDVRILGGEVTIAEYVGGDVFVYAGTLTVLSSARIDGTVFYYGTALGAADLGGSIGGSVFGDMYNLRIDGPVGKHVDVVVDSALVLGNEANITGNVTYTSAQKLTRAQNAVVIGNIVENSRSPYTTDPRALLVPFIMFAFATLVVFVLLRNYMQQFVDDTLVHVFRNGLVGFAGGIVLLVTIGLLFLSVVAGLVGILGLFFTLFLYMLSILLAPIVLGALIQKAVVKTTHATLLWTLVGICVIEALFFIPTVGPFVVFMLIAVVTGSILMWVYERLK